MTRGGDKLIPWIIGLLPLLITLLAAGYAEPRFLALIDGDASVLEQRQSVLLLLLTAALLGAGLASWTAAVHRRYREQVALREQALREFNASVDEKVAEEVDSQRRRDKVVIQHAKMRAMTEITEMIKAQWLAPLETLPEHTDAAGVRQMIEEMTRTMTSLTELVRPDTVREPVDLSESIEQALVMLKTDLTLHNISVQTQLDCPMTLPLHRNEILQVLIGVIKNARDALVSRQVTLPRIDIECYETGQFIVIRICDNAGGVEANETDRIFEPYFTTKAHADAAGLDLYLARSIIEEHCSGELTFDNFDEGACFYIKIGKHQEYEAS